MQNLQLLQITQPQP